jgi:hypothetical protein
VAWGWQVKRRRPQVESVYLVRWPDGVTKVGYTSFKRWRTFELRGAEVLAVWAFDDCTDGLACEEDMQQALPFPLRFRSAREAIPYLGSGGGGYLECYATPTDIPNSAVLAMLASIATEHGGEAMARSMHGRNGRTNEDGCHLPANIAFSDACEKSGKLT